MWAAATTALAQTNAADPAETPASSTETPSTETPPTETPPSTQAPSTETPPSTQAPSTEPPPPAAQELFLDCLRRAQARAPRDEVLACLANAERAAPESLDSIRARAALSMIEALTVADVPPAPTFGAGRLELVGVSGLFGVWNAVAGGVSVASLAQLDAGPAFLGTAAGALVAGVGFGVGGYYLGEALDLDESKSKLVASGLIWGSNMGVAVAPLVASAAFDAGNALPLVVLSSIVAAGYVGGAGGLAAGMFIDLTPADVSMVNSGGFFGSIAGALVMTNLLVWQVQGTAPYSVTYVGFNAAGLVAGGLLAKNSDYTWGETLVADLGMAIGGTTLGLGSAGVLLFSSSGDERVAVGIVTGATAVGMAGGYAAGLATARFLRPADAAVQIAPVSGAVLDVDGNVVATAGFAAHF